MLPINVNTLIDWIASHIIKIPMLFVVPIINTHIKIKYFGFCNKITHIYRHQMYYNNGKKLEIILKASKSSENDMKQKENEARMK